MRRYVPALSLTLVLALLLESVILPVVAQDNTAEDNAAEKDADEEIPALEWPREVTESGAVVVLYQPQPETFAGDTLTGRAAVSVTPKGETEPKFGAVWIEAKVRTDREERVVELKDVKVTRVRFPDVSEANQKKLAALLERQIPKWAPEVSLDRLLTSLESAKVELKQARALKNDPPKFRFVTKPTELVTLSGAPELRPIKNSKQLKVINTIHLVVLDPDTKAYFLNLGELWMTAPDLMKGPWTKATTIPAGVKALTPKPGEDEEPIDVSIIPDIVVVDAAEELVTMEGEPKYKPLPGNELLYMSNTESTIFLDISDQQNYTLVSGRWFRSKGLEGPWTFVAADKLPASFGKIPTDSEVGDTRSFVAGTDEAKDAVMDAQIPQTAAIKRDDKSLKVTYDGDPKFQSIEETQYLGYAINSPFAVIRNIEASKPLYYCCHEGVWYVASSPLGAWAVAAEVPKSIYTIPASCPLYNVTYVKIYKVEPTVVYVGYLPGYTGCYVYGGTVVYGTGYHYTVWCGTVYYARPVTYGYTVRYYPSLGRWFSPFSVGGVVRRTRRRTRRRVNHRNSHHHHHHHSHHRSNKYNNHKGRSNQGRSRNAKTANRKSTNNRNTSKNRKNNHYADKKGNVHRQNKNGSQQKKSKSGWSNSSKKNSSVSRDSKNRSRGSSKSSSYKKSSSKSRSSGRSRSGGSRGGGGRRR